MRVKQTITIEEEYIVKPEEEDLDTEELAEAGIAQTKIYRGGKFYIVSNAIMEHENGNLKYTFTLRWTGK